VDVKSDSSLASIVNHLVGGNVDLFSEIVV